MSLYLVVCLPTRLLVGELLPHEALRKFCGMQSTNDLDDFITSKWIPIFNFRVPELWHDKSVIEILRQEEIMPWGTHLKSRGSQWNLHTRHRRVWQFCKPCQPPSIDEIFCSYHVSHPRLVSRVSHTPPHKPDPTQVFSAKPFWDLVCSGLSGSIFRHTWPNGFWSEVF